MKIFIELDDILYNKTAYQKSEYMSDESQLMMSGFYLTAKVNKDFDFEYISKLMESGIEVTFVSTLYQDSFISKDSKRYQLTIAKQKRQWFNRYIMTEFLKLSERVPKLKLYTTEENKLRVYDPTNVSILVDSNKDTIIKWSTLGGKYFHIDNMYFTKEYFKSIKENIELIANSPEYLKLNRK